VILLDTNVLSEFIRPRPDGAVVRWLDSQSAHELATTTITVFELLRGVALLPDGERREHLGRKVGAQIAALGDRTYGLDATAAAHAAQISASRERSGNPIGAQDALIAGIARSRGCVLATRNTRDFFDSGLTLVDPWQAEPRR